MRSCEAAISGRTQTSRAFQPRSTCAQAPASGSHASSDTCLNRPGMTACQNGVAASSQNTTSHRLAICGFTWTIT